MAVIGNLRVNLGLNSAEFDTGLDRARGKADGFAAGITRSLAGVAAAFAAAFSVQAMGQMADAWSDMNSRLRNATGSMEAGAAAMDRLQEIARRSYSSVNQTTEAFLRQTSTLSALGVSMDRQLDLTETLNNALVISATRGDRAASVMDAWGKAMSTGTLRGDELNAVITGSDRLARALADSMGINVTELRAYGDQGLITRDVMLGVTSQMERLRDEAADMPATIADGATILGDSLLQLVGRTDQAVGASGAFAQMLVGIGDALVSATPAIVAMASAVADGLGGAFTMLAPVIGVAATALAGFAAPAMIAGISAMTVAIGTGLVGAIRAVGVAMMANPLGLLIAAIAAAVTAAFMFRDQIKQVIGVDVVEVFRAVGNAIIGTFVTAWRIVSETSTAVWGGIVSSASSIPPGLMAVWEAVKAGFFGMIRALTSQWADFLSGLAVGLQGVPGMQDAVSGLMGAAGRASATMHGFETASNQASDAAAGFSEEASRLATEGLGAIGTALGNIGTIVGESYGADYLDQLTSAVTELWGEADTATQSFSALNGAITGENLGGGEGGGGGGGGGASTADRLTSALEAMRAALQTEEQAELASHQKRLEQIQAFYDQGLIQKAEYDMMMEAAHQQHSDRMSAITQKQVEEEARIRGQLVGHTTSILGSLSTIMENFGDDNLVASKAFAVAAAIINTAEGITKALAQGGILGFAGAAAVAAAGIAQISTIMSAKKGGSARPTVGASAPSISQGTAAAKPAQAVSISLQGDYHPTQQVEELISTLLDMQSDGHQIILERP